MPEDATVKAANQNFLDHLLSDNPQLFKEARDGLNDYTRTRVREVGFTRQILPPLNVPSDELTMLVDTDKPMKVLEKEPESPGAISVPFNTNAVGRYIKGNRYRLVFNRILGPQFAKDTAELQTYSMDIRQVLSDNSIKDIHTEEDKKFIYACNSVMVSADATVPETGAVHWKTISGQITRDNLAEATKVMPRIGHGIEPAMALVNHVSIRDILKFGRDEVGGDTSQTLFLDGFTLERVMGINHVVTIKTDLVPENTVFYFAEPQFLGKFGINEDLTLFVDKRAWMIEFFAYELVGASIGNIAGVARVDFDGTT